MTLKRSHKEIRTSIFIGFNVRNLTYNDDFDLFLERSLGQFEPWFKDRKDTPAD